MAKKEKAVAEEAAVTPAPEAPTEAAGEALPGALTEAAQAKAPVREESWEERQAREARENYERNNAEAIKSREEIMRRNGDLKKDEPFTMGTQAGVEGQCC
jgi:hypothetical protein